MTEHHDHDKQLDDYLHGKSSVSELYQQLSVDEPDAKTDTAILAAAHDATKSKPRHLSWPIPAAIAALLVLGVSLLWWQHTQTPTAINSKESAAPAQQGSLQQQIDSTLHDNPTADQWLEQILKLHSAGKTAQAASEFKKFRQAYPAYTLDRSRFGELQQYDK